MLARVKSIASIGADICEVSVEVDVSSRGFPSFDIVGLPGKSVSESRHRILTALRNAGISLAGKRVTVNLAPADTPKKGAYYDLPIAVGLVCSLWGVQPPPKTLFFGELSLGGELRYVTGAFLVSLYGVTSEYAHIIVPLACSKEVGNFPEINTWGISNIEEVIRLIKSQRFEHLKKITNTKKGSAQKESNYLPQILGQEVAKRALTISAAGGHNLLFEGPPGSGKTLMSKAYRDLLPDLTHSEAVETTKMHALKGQIVSETLPFTCRPFRASHHTLSYVSLIGGGTIPEPGEVSLAHNGVLFLDELLEFPRKLLEILRQPLEEKKVTIARARGSYTFPADFVLLAACNPCPCGYKGHPSKECTCTPRQVYKYRSKLSGPLLDRMDMHILLSPVKIESLCGESKQVFSYVSLKEQIRNARDLQARRFESHRISVNAAMDNSQIKEFCTLTQNATKLLRSAGVQMQLSARSYFKTIKVAQTVADLQQSQKIHARHVSEALQYKY